MSSEATTNAAALARRHLQIGWWALLVFLSVGLVLEALHGLKVGLYLDVSNETRRLMWRLAHAHGTLLALVNLAFAVSVERLENWSDKGKKKTRKGSLSSSFDAEGFGPGCDPNQEPKFDITKGDTLRVENEQEE